MAPKIESEIGALQSTREFYDTLAADYDAMTGFEARFDRERPYFRSLVEKYGFRTALDAGCGSGVHSILLAELGVSVTAVDASPQMLKRLRMHAAEHKLRIDAAQARFRELRRSVAGEYDAVFCLGNSLAHVLRADGLRATFRNFAGVLRPRGIVVLQLLNYERVLASRDRVQNAKEFGGRTFIRFYEYGGRGITFNVATLQRSGGVMKEGVAAVRIRPWLRSDILSALHGAGFVGCRSFGGISLEAFKPRASKDLVVVARSAG